MDIKKIKDYPDSKLIDCTPETDDLTCVPNQEKGALKKKILIPGNGDSFAEFGQKVIINYVCAYLDGTLIDSSYERGKPLTVILGNGQLIQGLEYALLTMKKGEVSFFKIRPCLNFTTNEKTLNLPENRTLLFNIELIDWKPVDLSPEYDESILKTQIKKGDDEFVNPKAGRQITAKLIGKLSDNQTVFDNREVTFILYENAKENGICLGVELCLLSMKRNEIANVKIKRKFAFDDKIPDQFKDKLSIDYDEIYYEIHLLSFELEKDVWEMSFDERFEEAIKSKQKGTEFFKQNKFDAAARHYQRIINYLGPDERHNFRERNNDKNELLKIAYLNLAQTYLSMNKGLDAIQAADMAIKLDPTNVKGFYRRAMGYFKINDFDKAIEDFDCVSKMEPNNSAAKKQRLLCIKELKKITQKEKKIFQNMFEHISVDDNRHLIVDENSDIFATMNKDDEDYVKFIASKQDLFTKPKNITP